MSLINLLCISSLRTESMVRRLFSVYADSQSTDVYDLVVVGGGIVGTATAREVAMRHPRLKLAIVEKEGRLAAHQSGHNSGVIHAGIYYKPGSLKAKLCVEGAALAYQYCDDKKIAYKKVGKLIVAVEQDELPKLDELYQRGQENGVKNLKLVDQGEIKDYEPNCVGLKAIWSPETGIVDWAQVNKSFGDDFASFGGTIHYNFELKRFALDQQDAEYPIKLVSKDNKELRAKYIVTAAGLHSDRVARMTGGSANPRIIPFRGEYLVLKRERSDLVRSNIYPVPDARFPFLGVHFTPRMDGSVWLGPNAVLAFKREGYRKSDVNLRDLWDVLSFAGFRKLACKYLKPGAEEFYRSYRIKEQVKLLQKYVPSINISDIEAGVYEAGIRAQALDQHGDLVDDFVFDEGKDQFSDRVLHVRNAPSPAATSSLAIARVIAEKIEQKFLNK